MKRLATFFLFAALCFFSTNASVFAHDDHHDHGERSKQEIFDELVSYYQAILITQKQLLESQALQQDWQPDPQNSKQLVLSAGQKTNPAFENKDLMSVLFAQVARAYRLGIELDCGHSCQSLESQKELDQIEKNALQRLNEKLAKHAKNVGAKTKRFLVEFFPEMYQYTKHHGWSFGLWLLVTEPLEHLVFSPFIGGLPICKFLYGVYFAIANPIRSFFGIALNRFDGRFDVLNRLKGALTSWVYERRFKKRMKSVMVESKLSTFKVTQKEFKKQLTEHATLVEKELSETPFWAEAYAYFFLNAEGPAGFSARPIVDARHSLFKDLAAVYGVQPDEVRFDRARRLIEGLRQISKVMAKVLDSSYYDNQSIEQPVTWFEFFGLKGFVGEVDRLIDLFSFNLQTIALSQPVAQNEAQLFNRSDDLRHASMQLMEDSVREIADVFEEVLLIPFIENQAERKAALSGLLTRVKLLSQYQKRIASGKACETALVPVKLR